jgi:hypothetical protein
VKNPGWSELVATNAQVQDEAVQALLGMNQKHILPCPRLLVFSAFFLPQSFSLLPTSPHVVLTPLLELEVGGQKWEARIRSQKW